LPRKERRKKTTVSRKKPVLGLLKGGCRKKRSPRKKPAGVTGGPWWSARKDGKSTIKFKGEHADGRGKILPKELRTNLRQKGEGTHLQKKVTEILTPSKVTSPKKKTPKNKKHKKKNKKKKKTRGGPNKRGRGPR